MNYLSIYNKIISRAQSQNRKRVRRSHKKFVYYENHHILPKCVGGSNDSHNLVLLTAREHFVAHQLLVKIYPNEYKLIFALRLMCANSNKNHVRNNREYEWIKRTVSNAASIIQKGKPGKGHKFPKGHTLSIGENNGMFGKNHTEETRKIQSIKAKNRDPSTYNHARLPKSIEHKENISKSKRFRKYKLISPTNQEYVFHKISEASNYSGISISTLIKLAGNRYKFDNCRGWKCYAIPLE